MILFLHSLNQFEYTELLTNGMNSNKASGTKQYFISYSSIKHYKIKKKQKNMTISNTGILQAW